MCVGAVLNPRNANDVVPGSNGIFLPIIVVNGRVIGTWKRSIKARSIVITASTFKASGRALKEEISGR